MARSRDARTDDVASDAWAELLGLKDEIASLVGAKADQLHAASRARTEAIAEQMNDMLHDVGETLKKDEQHLEEFIRERPLPALGIAFLAGLVLGVTLRALR